MKNLPQLIADITHLKPKYTLTPSDDFNPFMMQRWISMISGAHCSLVNEIFNKRHKAFDDNQMVYDLLKCALPKKKVGFPKYIKKTSTTVKVKEHTDEIETLADALGIPKKHAKDILDTVPSLLKDLVDDDKKYKKIAKAEMSN